MTPQEIVARCEQISINFDAEVAEFDFSQSPLPRQWFTEVKYYRMLAAYAKLANVQHGLDLGTSTGISALAMAKYAKKVTTVDTTFEYIFDKSILQNRAIHTWLVTGSEKPSSFDFSPYDMIFVDVNGHEGHYEADIHRKLADTWTGVAFYDDIDFPNMAAFWSYIDLPKVATDWHHSGFGVVQYGHKGT